MTNMRKRKKRKKEVETEQLPVVTVALLVLDDLAKLVGDVMNLFHH